MAESRLYKIAQPRNLLRSELHCLIQTGPPATDHDITESDQRVIFPTPPLFFLPCPKQLESVCQSWFGAVVLSLNSSAAFTPLYSYHNANHLAGTIACADNLVGGQ